MSTETSLTILVVILSVTLLVFLILGIIALVKFNKILGDVKQMTEKAENIVEKVDSVATMIQKAAGPATIAKIFSGVFENFKFGKHNKSGD